MFKTLEIFKVIKGLTQLQISFIHICLEKKTYFQLLRKFLQIKETKLNFV
jgi:hypothetical protein